MLSAFWLLLVSEHALSHGGGLNAQGCHRQRATNGYHCHRSSYTPAAPTRREKRKPASRKIVPVVVKTPSSRVGIETRRELSRPNSLLQRNQNVAAQRQINMELQRYLSYFGFNLGSIDGIVGPKTIAAVQAYQRTRSIPVTGKIDDALLRHMANEIMGAAKRSKQNLNSAATLIADDRNVKTENTIERIQFYLHVLEYYTGPRNGKINAELEQAIMRFQNSNRISVDGKPSVNLLAAIKKKL